MMKTILVPLDRSAFAEEALVPAATMARSLGARLDLVLVHQPPKLANLRTSDWSDEQMQEADRYLERIGARLVAHGVEHCTHAVLQGDVEDAIIERAHEVDANLIVLTSHGATGFSRARLGSVAYALVHESELPVLVLRASEDEASITHTEPLFRRILVPLDGSQASLTVLAAAFELARSTKAAVVLLRVVEPVCMVGANHGFPAADFATGPHPIHPTAILDIDATAQACAKARAELEETATMLADDSISGIESHVLVGSRISSAILDYATATNADMIAMSTHGGGFSRWLLGSVTDAVLRTTRLPLLLARPEKSTESSRGRTALGALGLRAMRQEVHYSSTVPSR